MSEINFDPVTLTQSLVKCASVTPKDEGALTVVENHLSAIGCDCHPLSFSGNNSYKVKNYYEFCKISFAIELNTLSHVSHVSL